MLKKVIPLLEKEGRREAPGWSVWCEVSADPPASPAQFL